MSNTIAPPPFSTIRAFFWPIYPNELKKLIPMLTILFLLSFDYNLLRSIKDSLVITAKNAGAETIPFIKMWILLPASVACTYCYILLSSYFEKEQVFYIILSLFLSFFALFAFYFYPNRETFHLHRVADWLTPLLPEGCAGFAAMIRYWSFSFFYVMAELWGNIIILLLFWGFANQITKVDEAQRFYGILGVGGNLASIAAGELSFFTMKIHESLLQQELLSSDQLWERSLFWLLSIVLLNGICAIALLVWLQKIVANEERDDSLTTAREGKPNGNKESHPRFSLRENIGYLINSNYILYLVIIVISYNIIINLVELLWKHAVFELYSDPISYNIYMSRVTTMTGVISTMVAFIGLSNLVRFFGWTTTAMITPLILLITSLCFLGLFLIKESPNIIPSFLDGPNIIHNIVFFGTLQNCLSRVAKSTLFDGTKEMAFLPLTQNEKIRGKALIDGVCQRLGKSGGSIIYQIFFLFIPTLTATLPYISAILFLLITAWIAAIRKLGAEYKIKSSCKSSLTTR